VILDPARPIRGLADSKVLPEATRDKLALRIRARSIAWAIASASVEEIDLLNILRAKLLAMGRAIEALGVEPGEVCVDGLHTPAVRFPCRAVVHGDATVKAISAASILAKTARDAQMLALDARYPQYGFAQHKGYATPEHLAALREHGPCELHRRSFSPVSLRMQVELPF
jgi:ribonuclease HII